MRPIQLAVLALLSAPAMAEAHDGSHAPDPNLHIDPSLTDCEVHFAPVLTQSAFRRFSREFGSVSSFKQGAPPDTLGKWRVSVGLEQIYFHVDERSAAWNDTFAHPESTHELGSNLAIPKLKVRVGVTDNTDLGVFYTMNPSSNYGFIGVDVKQRLLRQGEGMPITLSVRGAYTKTLFITDMDMHAFSAGASVGRKFWNVVTPYVGLGGDLVVARETARTVNLRTEVVPVPYGLAGVEVAFWHLAVGAEAQYSAIPSAQAMLSAVF